MGATGVNPVDRTAERTVEPHVEMSTAIVEAIATIEAVPPTELDVELYDSVDLDALDALCADAPDGFALETTVDGYRIRIRDGRRLRVERR